ncbi:MAG: heterocyst development glycosyltransferase HepC [Heteroscytonema crispum UTEX LB 1556]
MTSSIIPTLENYYTVAEQDEDNRSPYCMLQWRRSQLLVKPPKLLKQPYLSSLEREELLADCLKHSLINLVRIDPKLGEARLTIWAEACEQASKSIFLHIPSADRLPKQNSFIFKRLNRLIDWIAALVLLLAVSPVMLSLVWLMHVYLPGPLFSREWHVGERGKLFRVIKFRTTVENKKTLGNEQIAYQNGLSEKKNEQNVTLLGRWMQKYGLDNLPQLLNVLRGEMSLVGPRCWTLKDAVQLSPQRQRQLNKLPGITGSWQVEAESDLLYLDSETL